MPFLKKIFYHFLIYHRLKRSLFLLMNYIFYLVCKNFQTLRDEMALIHTVQGTLLPEELFLNS